MDVGYNCKIADKWIPEGESTGLLDIDGNEIKTRDKVSLNGCGSRYVVVGKNDEGFMLYFRSDIGSIGWYLNAENVQRYNIRVVESNINKLIQK